MITQNQNVAIIGLSFRLPGLVNDMASLWDFCAKARCSAGPVPSNRFKASQYYHPDRSKKGRFYIEAGSYLDQDVGTFDAPFFNISEAEAKSLDPQHRLMLETAFLALENAGINLESISGRADVGVFASGGQAEYEEGTKVDPFHGSVYTAPSNATAMFANRVSYFLNLKGPSITVDTACSSALTALHLAVESIKRGECRIAIVGGACLQLSPHTISFFSNLGTLSKDGISYSFDHRASGYGRGEGSVCLILKSSDAASRDNDLVRAQILASGVNHVGRSQGITLPDGQSQAELIARTYERAGVNPQDTDYVEAHGTGTERGDPIEAESIATGLKARQRGLHGPLQVGSVKSNFGHLEFVSGLVSIVKCVAMFERNAILPSANFERANPAIDLHDLNIDIPTKRIPWPRDFKRASVNNFGFGGSNAHVILEQASHNRDDPVSHQLNGIGLENGTLSTTDIPTPHLFLLSAKDEISLKENIEALAEWLVDESLDEKDLENLSYTLCCRRSQFTCRYATFASTASDLIQKLQGVVKTGRLLKSQQLAFIFTGQGAQWPQMGLSLMHYPEFAKTFRDAERSLKELGADWSLEKEVSRSAETSIIADARISQPTVTALQISLVSLLKSWNVLPTAVCGHSSGEIAAAFAAGYLDLDACMAVAYYRGVASSQLSASDPPGAMMAVGASPAIIEPFVRSLQSGLANIACYNSPQSVTVSGDRLAITELGNLLSEAGIFNRMLKVDVAYHSDHMSSVSGFYLQRLEAALSKNSIQPSAVRLYSSVNGGREPGTVVASPWYWVTNLVCPVQFSKAIDLMLTELRMEEPLSLIEIGPHSVLGAPVKDIIKAHKPVQPVMNVQAPEYFSALKRYEDERQTVLDLAASLFIRGVSLDTSAIFSNTSKIRGHKLLGSLPEYRFNKSRRYWHETRLARETLQHGTSWHMLLGHKITGTTGDSLEFRNVFSLDDLPWLRDHQVNGDVLFPAAGYLCMAIEALKILSQNDQKESRDGYLIREATISKALRLQENVLHDVYTVISPHSSATRNVDSTDYFSFRVLSWTEDNGFSEHCNGLIRIVNGTKADEMSQISLPLTKRKWVQKLTENVRLSSECEVLPEKLYHQLQTVGLNYGPAFARVSKLRTGEQCAVGEITMGDLAPYMPLNFATPLQIDPASLDSILHVGLCNLGGNKGDPTKVKTHVPTFISELFLSEDFQQRAGNTIEAYTHGIQAESMARKTTCSMTCLSPGTADPCIDIRGFEAFDIQEDNQHTSSADTINPLEVQWLDHPSFFSSRSLDQWHDSESSTNLAVAELKALEQQAYHLFKWALSVTESVPDEKSHLFRLFQWMKTTVGKIESDTTNVESMNWVALGEDKSSQFIEEVALKNFQGKLNASIGRHLPGILDGKTDAMSVLFQRDGLWRVYEESTFFSRSNRQLAQLVAQLGKHDPCLRILEVGAGTGGLTSKILSKLNIADTGERLYSEYDYTDISTGFFDNARSKFENFPNMRFKKFDVTVDPAAQGFEAAHYDLIVAMDVIHATPDVTKSLQNMRKLLRPNGVLALVELHKLMLHEFPFAALPGWWQKNDGPIIEPQEWQELLLKTGYHGATVVDDFPGVGVHKIYWATAKDVEDPVLPKVNVSYPSGDQPTALARPICSTFGTALDHQANIQPLAASGGNDGAVIVLDEEGTLLLDDMSKDQFEKLQGLAFNSASIMWVTRSSNPKARFSSGFIRSLQLENPQLKMALLHLDPDDHMFSASSVVRLWKYLHTRVAVEDHRDIEFLETRGRIQVPRLTPSRHIHELIDKFTSPPSVNEQPLSQINKFLELKIGTMGLFSTLMFEESQLESVPLEADEVLIQIEVTGLNFKDLLIGLGSLPWQGLGRECSGVVIAAGDDVQEKLPVGSRVMHWGDGLFATHTKGNANNTLVIPDDLTFEEAAAIPVAYTTAYESLVTLGKLDKNERVLIHAAAGGVGQAAIMIAQWIGAEVFCTVGSREKKDLIMELYKIPEDHIFSSRNPSFAEGLLAMTDKAGVDVVVNSLAGDLLRLSWQCIAKFGRFVDISKKDAVANTGLEMAPFDRGATYTALDLSLYPDDGPRSRSRLTTEVLGLFKSKAVAPLHPINIMPVSDLESAFRMMQMGKHMGKIVIRNDQNSSVKVASTSSGGKMLQADATYVITGGGGGLGQHLGQRLLDMGARHVVLASRSAHTLYNSRSMKGLMKNATEKGGEVLAVACDVSSLANVENMVATLKGMPPIRGVIHGAMVLKDSMLETTVLEDWQSPIQPKVQGALNLHQALATAPLDFFICLSSLVGTVGNAGQSSYAGSNSFLDAFCRWRVSQGLPAASVALPAITDVGYVANMTSTDPSVLESGSLYDFQMTGDQVSQLLQAAMDSQKFNSQIVGGVPGSSPIQTPHLQNPILTLVRHSMASAATGDTSAARGRTDAEVDPIVDRNSLQQATTVEAASKIIFQAMAQKIAKDMMISPQDISLESSLAQIGLDSLVAVEFRNWLAKELSAKVRVLDIINCKSIHELVVLVTKRSSLCGCN